MAKTNKILLAAGVAAAAGVATYLSGRKPRTHMVWYSDFELEVGGETGRIRDLAAAYVPEFYVEPALDAHPRCGGLRPDAVRYEAVPAGNLLVLNYFLDWQDEIHPSARFKPLHRIFRKVYYASARDIEFVQIGVSRDTGEVVRIAFERDPSNDPFVGYPIHQLVVARRDSAADDFKVEIDGEPFDAPPFEFNGRRAKMMTATWNHEYDFYKSDAMPVGEIPLYWLTDDIYQKFAFYRRSKPPIL
mgnify:CR=1 FL=1